MLLAHGTMLPDAQLPALLSRLPGELDATLGGPPLAPETVIAAVDGLGRRLAAGEFDGLLRRFLPPGVTLDDLLPLLSRDALEGKLRAELGEAPFAPVDHGETVARRLPLGVLLHIAPGNQPGLPVYSVLEGLLTGNVNLLKLPHGDKGLSLAALSLLCQAEPRLADFLYVFDLPSSDRESLQKLAALADGVVTWGSDAAVAALRQLAPPGCRLIEWGHKLSFAYIAGFEDEQAELAALADHIVSTGQRLCSSCQVIYLDPALNTPSGTTFDTFATRFLPFMDTSVARLRPPVPGAGALSALYGHTALLERAVAGKALGEKVFRGRGCSLVVQNDMSLELSPMEANVLVKPLPKDRIIPVLRQEKHHLQTAALLSAPRDWEELTGLLLRAGVTRVTRAGFMSTTFPGEAHDGAYPLRRYTRIADLQR